MIILEFLAGLGITENKESKEIMEQLKLCEIREFAYTIPTHVILIQLCL